ncbi:right-handed parallel beta-helix repeat-containing protein [Luteolibacter marinus]|uniref:right-handed parallel beta-helix repeat-containing protein n=1 Tax=Luteolibacter marinus TaxID=2776705 RepID=UPI00186658CC|nr:right-handed parallel beta-helix repeat-containing protein [Luteolibacter marinus]
MKQEVAAFAVYLNGQLVASDDGTRLPPAGGDGFRDYDLSNWIHLLRATGNLLAIHTDGKLLVPVLHGTPTDQSASAVGVDPRRTRRTESGEVLSLRVFRQTPTSNHTLVHLATEGVESDFRIRRDGMELPLIPSSSGSYFDVRFATGEESALIEFETIDDDHAEAQETVELTTDPLRQESIRLVIGRNDTVVTRTAASGEGSLFQAFSNADLFPGVDTVRFSEAEGVPFTTAPVTISVSGAYRGEVVLEGPPSPGRVTIQGDGGTLFVASGQAFTLRRLVIRGSSNVVSSSRYQGTILVEDCEFLDNGSALNPYTLKYPAVIRRCLFEGNRGRSISYTYGLPIEVENCTFTRSQGTDSVIVGEVRLTHCSFISNSSPLILGLGATSSNSLFLGNSVKLSARAAYTFDQGGNLFDAVETRFPSNPSSTSVSVADAGLGEFGFHGGFTRTIPILAHSPALDLGIPIAAAPEFDQRGEGFQRQVGPAADAGAYELQFNPDDVAVGLATGVSYDPIAGIYFQFVVVHNTTPWPISGFRLAVSGLPGDAYLYNASGDGFIDVTGPIPAGDYRVVMLQYAASRPDLWLNPNLSLQVSPDSVFPEPAIDARPELALTATPDGGRRLELRTEPGRDYQVEVSEDMIHWRPAGPELGAESCHTVWNDPDPAPPTRRYYRVKQVE